MEDEKDRIESLPETPETSPEVNRKAGVISNFLWRFLERIGAQGVTFIVELVLARLLNPSIYGTLALVTVFTTLLQVFVDSGLGNALIQKKDADDTDFSSVFYFNVAVCTLLYGVMFIAAGPISRFYDKPELVPVIRVMSLILVISGVKNVQQAYVSRHMLFKKFFFATLGGTVCAAVIGIWMAIAGYGVWALVAQNLVNMAMDTLILWITVPWRPKKRFSWERLKGLLSFGWKLLASKLLDTLYDELRQLLIGKYYTDADLAFYNQGKRYPHFAVTNINYSLDSVLFPTLSKEQSDIEKVRNITRRAIQVGTYLLMPVMTGIAVCAKPLISMLLTAKWLPVIPYLRIFCACYAFYTVNTANLNAIKALGHSELVLKLEFIKKGIGLALLLSTLWISVEAMAYSLLLSSLLCQIINASPNRRLLGYSYRDQLKDMLPQLLLSLFMGACVLSVLLLGLSSLPTILIQVPLGVAIYWGGSVLFKLDSYHYLLATAKELLARLKARKAEK